MVLLINKMQKNMHVLYLNVVIFDIHVFGHSDNNDDDGSQINEMSQLTIGENTINYDAITRPTYGFLDKHNVPVLYASTSSLTSSYNKKTKSQSSKTNL
jgi:hypothetical protein